MAWVALFSASAEGSCDRSTLSIDVSTDILASQRNLLSCNTKVPYMTTTSHFVIYCKHILKFSFCFWKNKNPNSNLLYDLFSSCLSVSWRPQTRSLYRWILLLLDDHWTEDAPWYTWKKIETPLLHPKYYFTGMLKTGHNQLLDLQTK